MKLYHYCSNESFVEIVKSRSIWLSLLTLSNDYMEGKWIREVFRHVCEDLDVSKLNIEQLLEQLDSSINFWGGLGFCMSTKPDVLSQWRSYADDGSGVSVGFPKDYLMHIKEQLWNDPEDKTQKDSVSTPIGLSKVTYNLDDQKKKIRPVVEYIMDCVDRGAFSSGPTLLAGEETKEEKEKREKALKDLIKAFGVFFILLYSLKNPAFEEEAESRLVAWLPQASVDGEHLNDMKNLEIRARGNHIVPYLELKLLEADHSAIDEVWLGPRNTTPEKFVEAFLEKHGFPKVKVCRSSASYRR